MREIYYQAIFGKEKQQNEQCFIDFSKQLIKTGQPIELIDGDSLSFISDIYDKIYNKDD